MGQHSAYRSKATLAQRLLMSGGRVHVGGQFGTETATSLVKQWSCSFAMASQVPSVFYGSASADRGSAMEKIDTMIVDDEILARQKLCLLLERDPIFRVVAQCGSAEDAIRCLRVHRPALMFLDIQMPDESGFAVVDALDPDHRPRVIFTTAYDQYAVQAFEAQAIDYLLKPFDEERFDRAVKRAKDEIFASRSQSTAHPPPGHNKMERFIVKSEGRILFFTSEEIDWIEAASNYVRLFSAGKGHLVRHTMNELEQKLDPATFLRIHRSIIVNVHKIRGIQPCNSGEFIVTLTNGKELPSSRGYRRNLGSLLKSVI